MKLKAILICMLAGTPYMQAQTSVPTINTITSVSATGTLTGKVIDKRTNEALPYASIAIKEDGKLITGAITKDNGSFTLTNLPLKTLSVEILFMGYKKYETSITLNNDEKNINLKNIALEEEAKQLNEVSVVKEKSTVEQKIDRKVITVGKDLVASGATAAELMNNIPSVSVDVQNNTVSLRGNENVRIFIDGKPSNLSASQVLQQIPSTSIKQIELITNPSAKYNPEGMSGIINIVLNKNANMGFNGSINTGAIFAVTPKFNGSLDLNYKVNKFNFYANYSYNHGRNNNRGLIHWNNYDNVSSYDMEFIVKPTNNNHFSKTGTDFYINEKNTLSAYTIQSANFGKALFINDIHYKTGPGTDIKQIQNTSGGEKNQTYNLAYKHLYDKEGKSLDIELNYNLTAEPENSLFTDGNNNFLRKNDVTLDGKNFIGNIDFVTPVNENTKIELGLESRFDNTQNNLSLNEITDSDFNFKRNIQSAYGNYNREKGKWNYQLGIRLESYDVKGTFKKVGFNNESFKDYIFTAYPSAFLTYNASDKNSFAFNYSRRVDRPNLQQVNKIRQWSGATIEQIGNSELKPQFTNSFDVSYTRKLEKGSITTSAFVRFVKDEIDQLITSNPYDSSKRLMTFTNFKNNQQYGLEVSGNYDFKKWWNVNFGLDSYFVNSNGVIEKRDGNLYQEKVNTTLFNSRMNHTFKLNKDFRLIWFTMYRAGQNGLQFSNKDMWKTDLAARVNILEGKGSLSLRFNDIFKTMQSRFYSSEPANIDGTFRWESQSVNLNFNYRFGSGKNKALDRKQRDKNESQGGGMF